MINETLGCNDPAIDFESGENAAVVPEIPVAKRKKTATFAFSDDWRILEGVVGAVVSFM